MILSWHDFTKKKILLSRTLSITVGVFDGVHIGHRELINTIQSYKGTISAVVTFNKNPRIIFKDYAYPGNISTLDQKIEILQDLGVEAVIVIDFSTDFSRLSGEAFLQYLYESCNLENLVLGENFRFGYKGKTTAFNTRDILKKKKIKVEICRMSYYKDNIVSSTRIRKSILKGRISEANAMLNRVFSLDIASIPQIFREETIIIESKKIHQVLPPQGHYDVTVHYANGKISRTECAIEEGSHIIVNTTGNRDITLINFNADKK